MTDLDDKAWFYCQCLLYGEQQGYKFGWTFHTYRARFDESPGDEVIEEASMLLVDAEIDDVFVAWLHEYWGKAKKKPKPPSTELVIPEARRKQLLSLCHPDKWHGSAKEQTAVEVTQWLIAMK